MKTEINNIFFLMLENPQFSKFVKENENKTIEEIMMDYDINIDFIKDKK